MPDKRIARRSFLGSAVGGAVGLVAGGLAACGGTEGGGSTSATVSNMPPKSDTADRAVWEATVRRFEKAHPGEHVVGSENTYDPKTYFARLAGGQAEDATRTFFSEPPLMIDRHYAADITELFRTWRYFGDISRPVMDIVTGGNGRLYGVPTSGYALSLLYSRSLFRGAGLDPDRPPATWDEFRETAKAVAGRGVAGYAETTLNNGGGWHFVNWMCTVDGGEVERRSGKGWRAVYNSEAGVKVLELLRNMRFTDRSLGENQLYDGDNVLPVFANKKVGMIVTSASRLADLKTQYQADLDDIGMAPMPQNGGNGCLAGGDIWVFNPKASAASIRTAYDYVVFAKLNLDELAIQYAAKKKAGIPVGMPTNVIFQGEFANGLNALLTKYSNVPRENYTALIRSTVELKAEPPVEVQKLYAGLDPVVQKVLTDPGADPKALLDDAAATFQSQVLDKVKPR